MTFTRSHAEGQKKTEWIKETLYRVNPPLCNRKAINTREISLSILSAFFLVPSRWKDHHKSCQPFNFSNLIYFLFFPFFISVNVAGPTLKLLTFSFPYLKVWIAKTNRMGMASTPTLKKELFSQTSRFDPAIVDGSR